MTLKKEMKNHPCRFKLADVQSWHIELETSLIFLNEFNFFKLYLFLAVLGFRCCEDFSLVAVPGLLLWQSMGSRWTSFSSFSVSSLAVVSRLSHSRECGIFPDQGWNPRPLHWQLGSLPLSPRGPFSIF